MAREHLAARQLWGDWQLSSLLGGRCEACDTGKSCVPPPTTGLPRSAPSTQPNGNPPLLWQARGGFPTDLLD